MRLTLVLLAVLMLGRPGVCDPPARAAPATATAEQAAAEVRAAVAAKDDAALKTLAARDDPDPWLVADEFARRGELDVAVAFATAAPRADTEALAAYVEARRGRAPDEAERTLLAALDVALAAGDARGVVEGTEALPATADGTVAVRLRRVRGRALRALGRTKDAVAVFRGGAEAALALGWLREASSLLGEAVALAYDAMDRTQTFEGLEALLAVHERRGDAVRTSEALNTLGSAYHRFGDHAQALTTFERLLARAEAQGNAKLAATVVGNLGVVHRDRKDFAAALQQFDRALERFQALDDAKNVAWMQRSRAEAYTGLGEHAQALAAYERALAGYEALRDEHGMAWTLFDLGFVHQRLGDRSQARARWERALVHMDRSGNEAEAVKVLANLAMVRGTLNDPQGAIAAWQEVARRSDALGLKDLAAEARNRRGLLHASLGEQVEALAAFGENLSRQEALGDKAWMAASLINMGRAHLALKDHSAALAHVQRGLVLAQEVGHTEWTQTGMRLLGTVYLEAGEHGKALAAFDRFREQRRALGDDRGVAAALSLLGSAHRVRGDFGKALGTLEEALQQQERLGDAAGAAGTLTELGLTYVGLGEYARALSVQEQALARKEALGDKDGVAGALINLSNTHQRLGDNASALLYLRRGHVLAEEIGNRHWTENALNNLGLLYFDTGEAQRALETWERGKAAYEALGDRLGVAITLNNMGLAYAALGDNESALAAHERALELGEQLGDKAGIAMTLNNLGRAHDDLGHAEKARTFYERAAREARSRRLARELVLALTNLTNLHLRDGNPAAALRAASEAVGQAETMLAALGEEQGARARESYASLYAFGAVAALRAEDPAELLRFLESGRAGALLDALDTRDVVRWRTETMPEELRRLDADAQARERAAREEVEGASRRGDRAAARRARQALDEAVEGVRLVADRIQRELKLRQQATLFYTRARTLEEIRASLREDQALVLYGLCQDEALALVLRADGERMVPLGKAADVVAACEALDATTPDGDVSKALDDLRARIVAPLRLEEGVRQVLVSPDGRLCYLPFNALFDRTVAMTPSGTTHLVLAEEDHAPGEGVLAVGDPDYAGVSGSARATYYRGRPLSALPATRLEAEAIGTRVLLGADANEPGFVAAVAASTRWSSVHFACHGLVNVEKPMLSALALSRAGDGDGFLTAREILWTRIPADLVVLSACETAVGRIVRGEGIVGLTRAFMYAGTPRVICSLWKVDDEATAALMKKFYEYWLGSTPREPGAAPGESQDPERAQRVEGSRGLPAAEALRQAQEFIRSQEKWRHPYYWAAWVLWGLP